MMQKALREGGVLRAKEVLAAKAAVPWRESPSSRTLCVKEEGKIYGRTEYLIDYYYWMYHYVRVFLGDGDGIFLAEPDSNQEYGGKGK